ncbi:vitamin K epoxide reductase family protein, partial [Streptomyces sp. NPDC004685]
MGTTNTEGRPDRMPRQSGPTRHSDSSVEPSRAAPESRSLGFALLLVITGAAGLLAAWVITIDKFKLLEDPNFTPGCSLNPVVSCGNIMKSDQASVFGFPNPMLGLAAYA